MPRQAASAVRIRPRARRPPKASRMARKQSSGDIDMRIFKQLSLALTCVFAAGTALAQEVDTATDWAYAVVSQPADGPKHTLPGAEGSYTRAEIGNIYGPVDWFPDSHPTMPDIVANGRFPRVWACSLCHYPNGKGRPENAPIQGLPKDYFMQQLYDFREGRRASAQQRKFNTNTMITIALGMTEEEIEQAAEYYSSMPWTPWIRVVETEEVPKSRTILGMYVPLEGAAAGMEPIGMRIIEMPEDVERVEALRDPRLGFVAYVPVGSVEKGKELVTTGGGGKTIQCTVCHGQDLNGLGLVPGIAGRSPSYMMRQLYDFHTGARNGTSGALMQPVVANLSVDEMLYIAAYVASVPVPGGAASQ
jgi:cytochrome c553